jgi:hypothetical protein
MSDKPDSGTFGRFVETPVAEMDADMKSAFEFTRKLRGQVPGPHKIWPANPKLIGPTNGKWGRRPGDYGRIAYFLTDGGTLSPPPAAGGTPQPATVLRVEFSRRPV